MRRPRRINAARLKHAGYVASFAAAGIEQWFEPLTPSRCRQGRDGCVEYRELVSARRARASIDLTVWAAKPVVQGPRLAVNFSVGLLGQGWSEGRLPAQTLYSRRVRL